MKTVCVFGGPNGAGKTTQAMRTLPVLGCRKFINADSIAAGLAPFMPESVALQSGRLMHWAMAEARDAGETFGFEGTLASRGNATFLRYCRELDYEVDLTYVWLRDVELAIQRVAARVRAGGHDVPEPTIRRRYRASLKNLAHLYLPQADTWRVYENSDCPRLIAEGAKDEVGIYDSEVWNCVLAC